MQEWRRTEWSLSGWLAYARRIEERRPSCHRDAAARRHLGLFPAELVAVELDRPLLRAVRSFLVTSHPGLFGRPARGFRATAPQTSWIVAIHNQLARLDHARGRNWPDQAQNPARGS